MNLVQESLKLDYALFTHTSLTVSQKVKLVGKKYLYFFARLFGLNRENAGYFLGRKVYFPNKYGYVGLQRVLVDNAFLTNHLPKNLRVLDIGAHAGEFEFFATKILKAESVLSIEPFSRTFKVLKRNNPNAKRCAVTNSKTAVLNISEISSQLNSLYKDETRGQGKVEEVPVIKLDDLIKQSKVTDFDLLKIDAEGAEVDILESGGKVLNKFNYILVEVELHEGHFDRLQTVLAILEDFKIITIGEFKFGDRSIDILLQRTKK